MPIPFNVRYDHAQHFFSKVIPMWGLACFLQSVTTLIPIRSLEPQCSPIFACPSIYVYPFNIERPHLAYIYAEIQLSLKPSIRAALFQINFGLCSVRNSASEASISVKVRLSMTVNFGVTNLSFGLNRIINLVLTEN